MSPTALTIYPLLQQGERFPFNRADAEGFVVGQSANELESYAGHLEGIACVERLGYDVVRSLGAHVGMRIYTTGGGAASSAWLQIRADMLNSELARAANASAAMGSAIIAASRTLFTNLADAGEQMVQLDCVVEPRPAAVPRYEEVYRRFAAEIHRRGYV